MRFPRITASAGLLLVALGGALCLWQSQLPAWPQEFDDHQVFPLRDPVSGRPLPVQRPGIQPPPPGETLRCPIVRDTWFSNVGEEELGNTGGDGRLKLKTYQEFSVVDLDPAPLRGRVIRGATLHVRCVSPEILKRVTVGTVAAEWSEGSSTRYRPQPGSSSFRWRIAPDTPWSFPGSDLSSVLLGGGHTLWGMADATVPDEAGWQRIAIEPAVVAARVAGISHGFVLFDDQGSEWTLTGDELQKFPPANRFVASREAGGKSAPWIEVVLGEVDNSPPGPCDGFERDPATDTLPAGEALIRWRTPADNGPAGPCGFFVEWNGKPVPRYLIPPAGAPGEVVELHLRDLPVPPRGRVRLQVTAVDGAGLHGPDATFEFETSRHVPTPLPPLEEPPAGPLGELPRLDGARFCIVDPLDKVHPVTGEFIPAQDAAYRQRNPLWNAADRQITLAGARQEIVGFQLVIEGAIDRLQPELTWERGDPGVTSEFAEAGLVTSARGLLPDPLLPAARVFAFPEKEGERDSVRFASLWCELLIPRDAAPGEHRGHLTLRGPESQLKLPVRLTIWPFALPDRLSFIPELNAYSLPQSEREYYRLAHRHRTVLNRLPYSQSGKIDRGTAPEMREGAFDWQAYDARYGPLLDGSAFLDLPRRGVPLETFYLPLHENWPTPIDGEYNGSYWADLAFTDGYRNRFRGAVAEFARHAAERGWNATQMQVYLNNKILYKKPGWQNGSSPWLLDEPAHFQDFWAVRWFGQLFHEGLAESGQTQPPFVFRVDISRPQWQRDAFDAVLDYTVCASGPGRRYRRLLLDNQRRFGQQIVDYGTSNPVESSNLQPAGWCLDAWCRGADGVLPWQTQGRAESWRKADQLALFYPPRDRKERLPSPSLRLKSYLRGQQDVEYLALWQALKGEPRWSVGDQVLATVPLRATARSTGHQGDEDAGVLEYDALRPQHLTALRRAIARELAPHAAELRTTPRPLVPERRSRRSRGGYVSVGIAPWQTTSPPAGTDRR